MLYWLEKIQRMCGLFLECVDHHYGGVVFLLHRHQNLMRNDLFSAYMTRHGCKMKSILCSFQTFLRLISILLVGPKYITLRSIIEC